VNPNHEHSPTESQAVWCDLIAHAAVRVDLASVGELRRQPGPPGIAAVPANFLKHADEQTVAGLSAIYHAIAAHDLQGVSFAEWGVLAAPRFLGRSAMIVSLQRYLAEGAWGVSPHMIPHRSLHALSGTISHALKIKGPNFGVGGGPVGGVEILLAAASLLARDGVPGLWVVWTALEPDGAMDLAGRGDPATLCRALAVALAPARTHGRGLRLRLEVGHTTADDRAECTTDYFYLETLLNELGPGRGYGRGVGRELGAGVRVVLDGAGHAPGTGKVEAACPPVPVFGALATASVEIKP
jgi:hypothetical protein